MNRKSHVICSDPNSHNLISKKEGGGIITRNLLSRDFKLSEGYLFKFNKLRDRDSRPASQFTNQTRIKTGLYYYIQDKKIR